MDVIVVVVLGSREGWEVVDVIAVVIVGGCATRSAASDRVG